MKNHLKYRLQNGNHFVSVSITPLHRLHFGNATESRDCRFPGTSFDTHRTSAIVKLLTILVKLAQSNPVMKLHNT